MRLQIGIYAGSFLKELFDGFCRNFHQKYNFSNSNINKQCLRIFWKILIFTKTGWIQSLYFWFTFEPLLSCKHGQNWTIQICQNQDPFFCLFRKNSMIFCNIWDIFDRKQEEFTCLRVEIEIWYSLFYQRDF